MLYSSARVQALAMVGLITLTSTSVEGIKDGNPRLWDRIRRCDDDYGQEPIDYRNPYDTTPCGPCEGIGGEVWGDALDEFIPANCTVLFTADEVDPVGPAYWEKTFSADFMTIMIDECDENGENCQFPGDSSVPDHEYSRRDGSWHMDFGVNRRLLEESKFIIPATPPPMAPPSGIGASRGKADVYHYPERPEKDLLGEMFVVSFTPVFDICICLAIDLAGPITNDHMLEPDQVESIETSYPVVFLGRELLGIEFRGEGFTSVDAEVDHWMKGPHHIWVSVVDRPDLDVKKGEIIRGWQPWNALQIFSNYRDIEPDKIQKLDTNPIGLHSACSDPNFPGITCGPDPELAPANDMLHYSTTNRVADSNFIARAIEKIPGDDYRGDDFEDMTSKLNMHLKNLLADSVLHKECSEFTNDELNDVMRLVHAARDPALQKIYEGANDPRSLLHDNTDGLESRFVREVELIAAAPELENMMRDGKCHEVVMWFIHHLSVESQLEVAEIISVPLLPLLRHETQGHGYQSSKQHQEIIDTYQAEILCIDCHLKPPGYVEPCPGGSLEGCIALCPPGPPQEFELCVEECTKLC